jgi:hypothetical protein
MSFATFNKTRAALLAACLSSLAVFGACDNPRLSATASAMGGNALAESGAPPTWYKGSAPVIRHQFDAARNRSWILAWDGVHAYDYGTSKKIDRVALPGWNWVGEPYGCAPALAIGPQGEAVISSDVAPVMWRVDPATLAVTSRELVLDADTDKDVGFSGLAYAPEHGVFIATSSFQGSVWRLDPALKTAQKIALVGRLPRACGWNVASPEPGRRNDQALSLCLNSARGTRQLNLAADLRSAHVVAQSCGGQG